VKLSLFYAVVLLNDGDEGIQKSIGHYIDTQFAHVT